MRALLVLFLFVAGPLVAQDFPALYNVAGVAADDVLNIRAEPNASSDLVGALAPDATEIEVLLTNQEMTWGMVNGGEQVGWVSLTYLDRVSPDEMAAFPLPLHCIGTEPFWSLDFDEAGETATWSWMPHDEEADLAITHLGQQPWARRSAFVAGQMSGFLTREHCSDGMSDREFGFSVDAIQPTEEGIRVISGCCTLN